MDPCATIFIIWFVVCFVVIDRYSLLLGLAFALQLSFLHLVVVSRVVLLLHVNLKVRNSFSLAFFTHVHVLVVLINMGIVIIHFIVEMQIKGTLHERLVLSCDVFWGSAVDNISVVSSS